MSYRAVVVAWCGQMVGTRLALCRGARSLAASQASITVLPKSSGRLSERHGGRNLNARGVSDGKAYTSLGTAGIVSGAICRPISVKAASNSKVPVSGDWV